MMERKEKCPKILDIGSGHHPRVDATHLCDLYVKSNKERGGPLLINDRSFIRCDIQHLPFKENQLCFCLCLPCFGTLR